MIYFDVLRYSLMLVFVQFSAVFNPKYNILWRVIFIKFLKIDKSKLVMLSKNYFLFS